MVELALRPDQDRRITGLDDSEVQVALRARNPHMPVEHLRTMAGIVSLLVGFVSDLPEAGQRGIAREPSRFRAALEEATRSLTRAHIEGSGEIERTRGGGLGEILSLEQGHDRLDRYATPKPIEEWAGPTGGAGAIEKRLGIARSTLNSWYQHGAVVGLLRGQRKLAYPLEQFVDARPLEGLDDILRLAPDARSAWLWARQPHGALDGQIPLALLRKGQKAQVVQVAERDFGKDT